MDILRLFSREAHIAGLEISDETLRLALLTFNKKKFAQEIKLLAEENLSPGTILNGNIVDEKALLANLQNLLKRQPVKINYIILSLPVNNIYTRIFSFPKNIDQSKLDESMHLAIQYQLPYKPEEIYMDWQKLDNKLKNEVFLAAVPKTFVNQYVNTLLKVALRTVAVEFHPGSFLRPADLPEQKSVLITAKNGANHFVYVVKDKIVRYSKVLPLEFIPADKMEEEINRIVNFYEAENDPVTDRLNLNQLKVLEKYADPRLTEAEGGRWTASLGAAMRGILPRSEDKLISLMPIGTEKAYEYQRATAFSKFVANLVLILSIFFCGVYAGVWLLMVSIQSRSANQVQNLSNIPVPAEAGTLEAKASGLNTLTEVATELVSTMPNWSLLLEELRKRVPDSINISSLNFGDANQDMVIVGTARNRGELNAFKKNLEESELIGVVVLPLSNLEQKENIPFSITFKLEDPQKLFTQNNNAE